MMSKEQYQKLEKYLSENFFFRSNTITGAIECKDISDAPWEELNEFNIYRKLKLEGLKISFNELIYLLKSDFVKPFNPIETYFKTLDIRKGCETNAIAKLCSYIRSKSPERLEKHFRKWLVRTVKCALDDTYVNKNALIFVGAQNNGKSSFIRFLCPKALTNYFTENIGIDKDALIALVENMIINLDELASFSKIEINLFKSILSKLFVKERHPFERKAKKLPRRASFIGSTNMTEFLTDPTGNVRWIPFEVYEFDWSYSKEISIDDVWCEAYRLYLENFPCDVTAEEIKENEEENKQFTVVSGEMELIFKYYLPGSKEDHDLFLTAGEIEMQLNEFSNKTLRISTQQIGRALRMLGYVRDNRYSKEKEYPIKAYYLKNRKNTP